MKKITVIVLALMYFAIPALSSACNKGTFTEIRGRRQIVLGETFEYSVKLKGQVEQSRWIVVGGQLLDEWYKGSSYYARVRWDTMNADNPSHIKVLGEDDCRMKRSESLYVTRITGSGSGENSQQQNGGQCGTLGKIQGPETVEFGRIYTYSSVVTGSFERGGWKISGGDVVRDWWNGNTYYAQVKWKTNNSNNPSMLNIWGDDVCGRKNINQTLYITQSRGGFNNSGGGFGPPQSGGRGVTLFSETGYRGFSQTFYTDVYNLGDTELGHDRAQSIQVSPGCEVILYRKSKYLGDRDIFTENAPNLNVTKVGKYASSLKIQCN